MGKVVGKVTDAVGLTNNKGAKAAADASSRASNQSYAMTKEQLAFQKEQYNDWKDVYGDLQEQLGDYYKNYTGADVLAESKSQVAGNLANSSREYTDANTSLTQTLAQRGLSGSGAEALGLTQLGQSQAQTDTYIRSQEITQAEADRAANEAKMQFLGLGLNQGAQMLGTIGNVANTGASNQMSYANNQSSLQGQLKTAGMQNVTTTAGNVMNYFK